MEWVSGPRGWLVPMWGTALVYVDENLESPTCCGRELENS